MAGFWLADNAVKYEIESRNPGGYIGGGDCGCDVVVARMTGENEGEQAVFVVRLDGPVATLRQLDGDLDAAKITADDDEMTRARKYGAPVAPRLWREIWKAALTTSTKENR